MREITSNKGNSSIPLFNSHRLINLKNIKPRETNQISEESYGTTETLNCYKTNANIHKNEHLLTHALIVTWYGTI